jgi:hypothetical protein
VDVLGHGMTQDRTRIDIGTAGTFTAKSGRVMFRDYDFKTGRYTGTFDLVFAPGGVVVKGEFRLPSRSTN